VCYRHQTSDHKPRTLGTDTKNISSGLTSLKVCHLCTSTKQNEPYKRAPLEERQRLLSFETLQLLRQLLSPPFPIPLHPYMRRSKLHPLPISPMPLTLLSRALRSSSCTGVLSFFGCTAGGSSSLLGTAWALALRSRAADLLGSCLQIAAVKTFRKRVAWFH
jgi:hypothetical protein